jgi:hypothetical protein
MIKTLHVIIFLKTYYGALHLKLISVILDEIENIGLKKSGIKYCNKKFLLLVPKYLKYNLKFRT